MGTVMLHIIRFDIDDLQFNITLSMLDSIQLYIIYRKLPCKTTCTQNTIQCKHCTSKMNTDKCMV